MPHLCLVQWFFFLLCCTIVNKEATKWFSVCVCVYWINWNAGLKKNSLFIYLNEFRTNKNLDARFLSSVKYSSFWHLIVLNSGEMNDFIGIVCDSMQKTCESAENPFHAHLWPLILNGVLLKPKLTEIEVWIT